MLPTSRPTFNIAYLLLATAPLCWAGNHVLGRSIAGEVSPGGLSMLRWALAALILMPFALPHLRRDWPALAAKPATVVLLALTGAGVFGTLQFVVAGYTSALNMSVLNSTAPVMILLASRLFFGDRLRPLQGLGVAISFAGVTAIATQGDVRRLATLAFERGDLLVIGNMMLWATYCACLRLRPPVHWLSFTFVLAAVSALANIPLATYEAWQGYAFQPTARGLTAVLYSGLCTSVIAYAAWNRGVEMIGAPRASAFLHLIPIYGAVLASLILGEELRGFHIAGFALILGGVSLAARAPAARPA